MTFITCCAGVSQKWIFAVMAFCSILCLLAMRMCLPLTIPKMTKAIQREILLHQDETCPSPNVTISKMLSYVNNNSTISSGDTYDWSEYTQGIILGAFYWGYVLSHVPGGILAERFGGKHVLGLGVLITSICTILTPLSIVWAGSTGLICLRVITGLCEGITQPGIGVLLAQWIPVNERTKMTSFVFTGGILGVLAISLGLGSILRAMNWQAVYYLFGGMGVLWYLLWSLLCYNSPREHPFISEHEAQKLNVKLQGQTHVDAPPVPWRHLLTSAPFWALVIATIGRDFGGYIMLTDMPKYTMNVLKMTVDENGFLYLVMHIAMFISMLLFSWLSDWLIKNKYMSRTLSRKIFTTVCLPLFGGCMLISSYVGCNKVHYVIVACFMMAILGAGFTATKSNVLDLSPNYAGTVMAISQGIGAACGVAGPYVVGILVPNETLSEWRQVYWIIFVVAIVTNAVFLVFGSGEVQDWNDPSFDRKKNKKFIELKEVEKLVAANKIQIVFTDNSKQ